LPNGNWDRLQPPNDPELDEAGIENGWMDEWTLNKELIQYYQLISSRKSGKIVFF